ncbi:phosphatidylserine/phosphatidylglycerophosphate/cardiolipin synthase family protein [Nocardioidaceae bacterium]|nr:phosphatidylserine/phosphatidylglycerophosphate/cardiolipin synthase family protein [Nocardioidaceae bacterium]
MGHLWPQVRRALLGLLGLQVALALILTLVDSWRRRGRRPKPFPRVDPVSAQVGGSELTVYTYGEDLYGDMLAAIESARETVLIESYIWKGDTLGEKFRDALARATERGVEVYAAYDGFANLVVRRSFFANFPPDVRLHRVPVYNAGWRFWDLRRYGRNHRKILVVDNEVGFVGGYNIGTAFATQWRDTHVRLTGPAVTDLTRAFADLWNISKEGRRDPLRFRSTREWEPRVRVHRNVPRTWVFPIRGMYLEAINRAERSLWMTHAYFTPDDDFVAALTDAARRGVDVRLLLPRTSNHVVADWISRGYFDRMLRHGIRVFRYEGAMVHAKTATADGRWATVGTANIDRLSMSGNYEINLEIIDEGFAETMEKVFLTDLGNCSELSLNDWRERGPERRFTEAVLRPLRRIL